MKVVFMEDVPNVGKAGQIKDVADGYGKNYLIPHKLAVPARVGDIKNVEAQIKARARIAAKTEEEMKAETSATADPGPTSLATGPVPSRPVPSRAVLLRATC